MFKNNRNSSGLLWGTILGTSIGLLVSSQMTPMNKRKIRKTAKRASSNLKDMME